MEQIIKTKSNDINILDFIKNNDYNLKLGNWFTDIWIPLYDKKEILITDNIINFIHNGTNSAGMAIPAENVSSIKRDIVKMLRNNKILYTEIKYDNPLADKYQYIKKEIEITKVNNLKKKTWILLTTRNFKSFIMRLNTEVAQEIREYYITLEEILFDYINHVNDCEIIKRNNEIGELKNILNEIKDQNKELLNSNKDLMIKYDNFKEKYDNDIENLKTHYRTQRLELKKNNKKISKKLDKIESQNSDLNDQISDLTDQISTLNEEINKKSTTIEKKQNRIIELVSKLENNIIQSLDPNKKPMLLILYFQDSGNYKIVRGQKKRINSVKKQYQDTSQVFYCAYEPNPITFFDTLRTESIQENKLIFSGTNHFQLAEDYSQEEFLEDLEILGMTRLD